MLVRNRRAAGLVAALSAVGALFVAPSFSHADPPPNPSDGQIAAAQAEKEKVAGLVGSLSAKVARMRSELDTLHAQAELAEQKYADALDKLHKAQVKAAQAKQAVTQAQRDVDHSRAQFVEFIRAQYVYGGAGPAGALLTSPDPTVLLQRTDYEHYSSTYKLDVVAQYQTAMVAKSNADAAARDAVIKQTEATDAAESLKVAAENAVAAAEERKRELDATLAQTQAELEQAQARLADLNNARERYNAWKKAEEERIARERAAAEAARRAAEEAAQRAREQQQNSGGGGGGGGPSVPVAPTPNGNWTPAAGQTAANRALQWLGTPYAFAGGGYSGPSYGVCVPGDAANDCHVYGFDCSGLAMFAWAPYAQYDHYAATQYVQAGSVHPDTSSLMPGDLTFWSSDGTIAGIHHVAIYIGNGNVVQAPFSGSYVQVTPLDQVSNDYFGATRPLT